VAPPLALLGFVADRRGAATWDDLAMTLGTLVR
jgi:hypothetical protein